MAALPEAVKDILACPIKFFKCVTNKVSTPRSGRYGGSFRGAVGT